MIKEAIVKLSKRENLDIDTTKASYERNYEW